MWLDSLGLVNKMSERLEAIRDNIYKVEVNGTPIVDFENLKYTDAIIEIVLKKNMTQS